MISTLKADITGLDFDIIVNAANSRLLPGGGVCGAIFSKAGKEFGEFVGDDIYTTKESDRLLRLPMFYGLSMELSDYVIDCIHGFFR